MAKKKKYDIGYKKPPKGSQFKPGQSGNPKGRPRNSKNTDEILKKELNQKITLREGGKEIVLTKKQAMLRHLINKAVQGDTKSVIFLYQNMTLIEDKDKEIAKATESLPEQDREILMRFIESKSKQITKKEKKNDK